MEEARNTHVKHELLPLVLQFADEPAPGYDRDDAVCPDALEPAQVHLGRVPEEGREDADERRPACLHGVVHALVAPEPRVRLPMEVQEAIVDCRVRVSDREMDWTVRLGGLSMGKHAGGRHPSFERVCLARGLGYRIWETT